MDMTFWYILILVTNLSEPFSDEFTFKTVTGGKTTTYHIYNFDDDLWVIDYPDKNDPEKKKTKPLNFHIERKNVLKTLMEGGRNPISLDKIFVIENVDWKKTNELKVIKELQKEGWTSILVKRNTNAFSLSQKTGMLKEYSEISVKWVPKK
jgi:hypothetical protein